MGKEAAAVMQAPEWEGFLAVAAKSLQSCPTLSDSMDCSLPGSSVSGISQAYWGGLPFSAPRDLPDPGINASLLHWQAGSLLLSHLGSPSARCGLSQ